MLLFVSLATNMKRFSELPPSCPSQVLSARTVAGDSPLVEWHGWRYTQLPHESFGRIGYLWRLPALLCLACYVNLQDASIDHFGAQIIVSSHFQELQNTFGLVPNPKHQFPDFLCLVLRFVFLQLFQKSGQHPPKVAGDLHENLLNFSRSLLE